MSMDIPKKSNFRQYEMANIRLIYKGTPYIFSDYNFKIVYWVIVIVLHCTVDMSTDILKKSNQREYQKESFILHET